MAKDSKVAPRYDQTFEDAARAAGAQVVCLWQLSGIPLTAVVGMECLLVNGHAVIVQTFEGGGWDVFTPSRSIRTDESVTDALIRCGVKAPG